MISLWRRRFEKLAELMWVRASMFAVFGVAAALLAVKIAPLVPDTIPAKIGSDAVHQILNILASSMLAVTTFSLSVMVASYSAAASNVTPRATRLMREDPTTQNALAVFLGSFLFSLVGIAALNTGYYSEKGRFVLFVVSIGVIGIIVFTMLSWIDHLTRLGRVGETTARVEDATANAIDVRLETPYLGGNKLNEERLKARDSGHQIFPETIGYVAFVDMQALEQAARQLDAEIHLHCLPGAFAHTAKPLAELFPANAKSKEAETPRKPHAAFLKSLDGSKECLAEIRRAFEIAHERSYTQDPRFGLSVLGEVGSRALSPAMNDAGTAIDVIGRGVRLLARWSHTGNPDGATTSEPVCDHVFVPALDTNDLFDDLFAPIARDGARVVEVQIRLQKAFLSLAQMGDEAMRKAAYSHSQDALQRAEAALLLETEKDRLRAIAKQIEEHLHASS